METQYLQKNYKNCTLHVKVMYVIISKSADKCFLRDERLLLRVKKLRRKNKEYGVFLTCYRERNE